MSTILEYRNPKKINDKQYIDITNKTINDLANEIKKIRKKYGNNCEYHIYDAIKDNKHNIK